MTAIIDINAWTGSWASFPVEGDAGQVRDQLHAVGVQRICMAPLGAAWGHNPHVYNEAVYQAASGYAEVEPVPVLDPTIPTWKGELARAAAHPGVQLVKLLPNYHQYQLAAASELLSEVAAAGLVASVQTRLEDPRRQHPLALVAKTSHATPPSFRPPRHLLHREYQPPHRTRPCLPTPGAPAGLPRGARGVPLPAAIPWRSSHRQCAHPSPRGAIAAGLARVPRPGPRPRQPLPM